MGGMKYWLIKSEPDAFSIDDMEAVGTESWDGVRNYQARNFMRDEMEIGDRVLFYHSSCKVPGVVGIVQVASRSYPDHTAWDERGKYYDPKSTEENPRWVMVDFEFVEKFDEVVSLEAIKAEEALAEMYIRRKGNRLSITPVEAAHFEYILAMRG